jgi:hypothetical protein
MFVQGRARGTDAEYVILVDEELMEDFSEEIEVFKGIEQVCDVIFNIYTKKHNLHSWLHCSQVHAFRGRVLSGMYLNMSV